MHDLERSRNQSLYSLLLLFLAAPLSLTCQHVSRSDPSLLELIFFSHQQCQLHEENCSHRGRLVVNQRPRDLPSPYRLSCSSGVQERVPGAVYKSPLTLSSAGRGDGTCWRRPATDGFRECTSNRGAFDRRREDEVAVLKRQRQDGKTVARGVLRDWKTRPPRIGCLRSSGSGGSRSNRRKRRGEMVGAPPAVARLRGGDASPASSSSPSKAKVDIKEEAPWGLNLKVFGWGREDAEAKAEAKRKAEQEISEAQARDVMRKAREERFEKRKNELHYRAHDR